MLKTLSRCYFYKDSLVTEYCIGYTNFICISYGIKREEFEPGFRLKVHWMSSVRPFETTLYSYYGHLKEQCHGSRACAVASYQLEKAGKFFQVSRMVESP